MIYEMMRTEVLRLAQALGEHTNCNVPSVFAHHIRDPKAGYRVLEGEDFKVKTVEKWVQLFSNAWPDDLPWPDNSFARPPKLSAEEMEQREERDKADREARRTARAKPEAA